MSTEQRRAACNAGLAYKINFEMASSKTLLLWFLFAGVFMSGCDMNKEEDTMPDVSTFFEDAQALALAEAIEQGDINSIDQLAPEFDINQPHTRGMTFLNWAIANKRYDSAQALLAHRADPDIETEDTFPLSIAITMEDDRWLKLLVEAGADVNRVHNDEPIWFQSILAHRWSQLDYLLDKGVDVNATDGAGQTAIFDLAGQEHYDQVLKLIKKGADTKVVTPSGLSFAYVVQESTVPSAHSQYQNREKVVGLLEQQGITLPVPSPKEVRKQQSAN